MNTPKTNNIQLFNGDRISIKMKYSLLLLTLWQIRDKNCMISYALESIKELGVIFEKYDDEDRLESCSCSPVSLTEQEYDDFYINISMIRDHFEFIFENLKTLQRHGIQQDYFDRHRRKNPASLGIPDVENEIHNVDVAHDDDDDQGELFDPR